MRTIKFRGKRVDNGAWVYGDLGQAESGHRRIYPPSDEIQRGLPVVPESVGQFTGLQDKDGKDIYEGDICRWDDRSNGIVQHHKNGGWKCGSIMNRDWEEMSLVIGNPHDNPELLKAGSV